jgi:Fur family ferric uptake transcriptional regulator
MTDHHQQPTFHDALISVLREQARYMSVIELRDQLRARGHRLGRTTMYRLLETMVRRGDVQRIVGNRGEACYRWISANSELYPLICRKCRRIVEVDGAELERWAHETAAQHGFSDIQLHTMIIGVCPACLCAEVDNAASSA